MSSGVHGRKIGKGFPVCGDKKASKLEILSGCLAMNVRFNGFFFELTAWAWNHQVEPEL